MNHKWILRCPKKQAHFFLSFFFKNTFSTQMNMKIILSLWWSLYRFYLRMRRRQALADVHPEKGIFAEGDVELQELWLAEVEQGPPKHSRRDFLGHPPPNLDAAWVYTAVPACPWTWSKGERNCIICDSRHWLVQSIVNHPTLMGITWQQHWMV